MGGRAERLGYWGKLRGSFGYFALQLGGRADSAVSIVMRVSRVRADGKRCDQQQKYQQQRGGTHCNLLLSVLYPVMPFNHFGSTLTEHVSRSTVEALRRGTDSGLLPTGIGNATTR